MIVIAGTLQANPEKLTEARAALLAVQEATRANDGCVQYTFSQDLADPALFHIFEYWDDADKLAAHGKADHFKAFNSTIREWIAGRPSILQYSVSKVGPLGG